MNDYTTQILVKEKTETVNSAGETQNNIIVVPVNSESTGAMTIITIDDSLNNFFETGGEYNVVITPRLESS